MKTVPLVLAGIMMVAGFFFVQDNESAESEPSRDTTFVDVAEDKFDQLSAPTFISAGDWNNDGYTDLLFNGYRLFENSGPPDWSFNYRSDIFDSSVSGSSNGVWADWDGDGDLDLYQGCRKDTADRFWENRGAPLYNLTDVSRSIFGNWQNLGPNTGNAWADFDEDGDLDIYVGNGEDWNDGNPIYYSDFFLRNDNGASLTDITSSVGIDTGEDFYSRGATWGDYNNDRWPDAYVSHYRIRENHLFENRRDGTMDEVGQQRNCSGTYDPTWYYDATAGSIYGQSLWGPMWGHTIGSSWADFNRDGNLDLWTSDFVHKYVGYIGSSYYDIRGYICDDGNLYINDGAPYYTFTDYRNSSGIPKWPIGGQGIYQGDQTFSGVTIGDYDNDGWEDIYIPQVYGDLRYTTPHLYRNNGRVADPSIPDGTTFTDVTSSLGIEGANTYANLWVDYDNDGDLDLVTGGADRWDGSQWQDYRVRLYQNQGTGGNHFLEVRLNGTGKNLDAVGARVTLRYRSGGDDIQLVREVRAGTGHAHQESNVLHFGLGSYSGPLGVEIIWPDGLIQYDTANADEFTTIHRRNGVGPMVGSYSLPSTILEDTTFSLSVTASSQDSYISNYLWDLEADNWFDVDTGATDRINIPVHHDGFFHVRARVVDGNNLARDLYPIGVNVINSKPVINLNDRIARMDSPLFLENIITDSPSDLANISWEVDWGDTSLSTGTGPLSASHVYTAPGKYQIKIVADDGTDEMSKSAFIEVSNVEPWGWVGPTDGNDTIFYEDQNVWFTPHVFDTPSDISDMQIKWDFGDGSPVGAWTSVGEIVHSYPDNGIYPITALVRDELGGTGTITGNVTVINKVPSLVLTDPKAPGIIMQEDQLLELDDIFTAQDTRSDMGTLEFRWDFGDNHYTQWQETLDQTHVYKRNGSYLVRCSVRDDDNAESNSTITVKVENPLPEMGEISQVLDLVEDEEFNLEFSAKDNPSDEESLSFYVDTGDGRTYKTVSGLQLSYPKSGYYDITVTVEDDDGARDSNSITIYIANVAPRGEISMSARSVDEDETVMLSASSIKDSRFDTPNITALWDPGDGSQKVSGMRFNHTYRRKGRYDVSLLLSDGDDTTTVTSSITVNNPVPTAHFYASSDEAYQGEKVSFDASNSTDNPSDRPYLKFYWDFGDGSTDEGMMVEHAFSSPGEYTVTLEVVDDDSSSGFREMKLVIKQLEVDDGEKQENGLSTAVLLLLVGSGGLIIAVIVFIGGFFILRRRKQEEVAEIGQSDYRGTFPGAYQQNMTASGQMSPGVMPGQLPPRRPPVQPPLPPPR
ncbi:MAG: PKD domain-containing protein [Thermoplasmatota archaeon]